MMEIAANICFIIYITCVVIITLFCLMQFYLLIHYLRNTHNTKFINTSIGFPKVTVQVPIYNEQFVAENVLDAVANFNYDKSKLQIQVLDDSTDETLAISTEKVKFYTAQGMNISLLHRTERDGYKAGALAEAMQYAEGEFIVIFDADFTPSEDFLQQVLPYFSDAKIGVIQTRWAHNNEDFSLLTAAQAFQLNVHFTIEQKGRENAGCMLQFNGTAGIWRKECILNAGGWEADTLTEDLDLSYRAQMKDWKIIYLPDAIALAELPITIKALKSQQFRWMKGGAETARKMIARVWNSSNSTHSKINAFSHLLSSSVFLFVFLLSIVSIPLSFTYHYITVSIRSEKYLAFTIAILACVYFVANYMCKSKKLNIIGFILKFLVMFPSVLAISMGLAFHNTIAVSQGWLGIKTAFVRTPKYGLMMNEKSEEISKKQVGRFDLYEQVELYLCLCFFCCVIYEILNGDMAFIAFHLMTFLGYGYITWLNFKIRQ